MTNDRRRLELDATMTESEQIIRVLDEHDPEGGVTDPAELYEFWEPQAEAILNSEWLARHDAEVAAKALEDAASETYEMRIQGLNRPTPTDSGRVTVRRPVHRALTREHLIARASALRAEGRLSDE